MERDVGITRVAGGSAAVLGGLMMLGGIIAAPFTLGGTLVVTASGAAIGAAGGLTARGGALAKYFIMKDKLGGELRDKCDSFSCKTTELGDILNGVIEPLQRLSVFLNDVSYNILKETIPNFENLGEQEIEEHIKAASKLVLMPLRIVLTTIRVVNSTRIGMAISAFSESVTIEEAFLKLTAASNAAPGLQIPGFVAETPMLRNVLHPQGVIQPARAHAVALQGTLAVVGIGFGVWDIVDGVQSLDGCSSAVNDLRSKMKEINSIMLVMNEARDKLENAHLI